jgi:hypothetical protein
MAGEFFAEQAGLSLYWPFTAGSRNSEGAVGLLKRDGRRANRMQPGPGTAD